MLLHRPVNSMAVYQSFDEFYGMDEFMKQFPNSLWKFHSESSCLQSLYEICPGNSTIIKYCVI